MLSIRPANPADLPAITAIYAHHVRFGTASFEEIAPDEEEMRRRFDSLSTGGYPYFVAELGGRVLGYGYAGPYRPRTAYRYSLEDSIYVDEAARGKGIGRALLTKLIAAGEEGGFRQMVAVIGDSANAASITLHERAGFAMVGTIRNVGLKHGRWLDTVIMQRELGDGGNTLPAA